MMDKENVILLVESLIRANEKRLIHISLDNKRFYNGVCLNFNKMTLSFYDNKLGEMEILYSQIVNIEPFNER